jgi:hypothetical protein
MNKGVKGQGAEVQVTGIRKLINRLKGVLKPWNPFGSIFLYGE